MTRLASVCLGQNYFFVRRRFLTKSHGCSRNHHGGWSITTAKRLPSIGLTLIVSAARRAGITICRTFLPKACISLPGIFRNPTPFQRRKPSMLYARQFLRVP